MLRTVDLKRYELKDHLGNVSVIVSDVKDATLGTQGGATAFAAIVEHYSNYYPFGMEKPSMVWDKGGYRYGFNGKENDDEVKGVGNHQDYGMRVYDPRVAKFLSVDPLTKEYPELTPYQFASNTPIMAIDLDGLEEYVVVREFEDGNITSIRIMRILDITKRSLGQTGVLYLEMQKAESAAYIFEPDHYLQGAFDESNYENNGALQETEKDLLEYWGSSSPRRSSKKEQFFSPTATHGFVSASINLSTVSFYFYEGESDFDGNHKGEGSIKDGDNNASLQKLVEVLNHCPSINVVLSGHTNSNADINSNFELSSKRIDIVKALLEGYGINSNRIIEGSSAGEMYVSPNTDGVGENINEGRRTDAFLVVPNSNQGVSNKVNVTGRRTSPDEKMVPQENAD